MRGFQLDVSMVAANVLRTKLEGLLGNFDGNPSNDLVDRYTGLQVNASNDRDIYYVIGPSCKWFVLLLNWY